MYSHYCPGSAFIFIAPPWLGLRHHTPYSHLPRSAASLLHPQLGLRPHLFIAGSGCGLIPMIVMMTIVYVFVCWGSYIWNYAYISLHTLEDNCLNSVIYKQG